MSFIGRPLKFQSVEDLQAKIDAYFYDCDPHVETVTEWVEARTAQGKLKKDKYGLSYLIEVTHVVKTEQKPYTVTGLALFLDTSRETLMDYQEKEMFSDTIKKAKDKVHAYVENRLLVTNPTGPIFNLKNNFGWVDKTETEVSGGVDPVKLLLQEYGLIEGNGDDRKGDEPVQSPSKSEA